MTRAMLSAPDSVEARLAGYISEVPSRDLPAEVEERTRAHLLDTLAAILSGRALPAGEFGYRFAAVNGSTGPSTILGDTSKTSPEMAAFANAMAAHADETDDSHVRGRYHPGCGIVPAAIAMAEARQASGRDLLAAIALGYDIGTRSTMALGFTNPRTTTFSTHSIGALFGASAAAGALCRLSAPEAESLLSFTVQQASGLSYWNRDPDHVEKSLDFGAKAARNGVFAALLADAGMRSPDHPLTGTNSYLAAFAENPKPDLMADALGERYEILNATIKKWSVGSPLQSMLDAIEMIFGGKPVPGANIADLELRIPSNRVHVIDDRHMPAVCAQHLAALAVLRGSVSFAASHDEALMTAPEILELRKRIRLVSDDALTEARPERQAIVVARMTDGQELRHHTKMVRGTPDDPMTIAEVAAKAEDILSQILPDRGAALIGMCLNDDFSMEELAEACRISRVKKQRVG